MNVAREVDRILDCSRDYERAHGLEDALMRKWIRENADEETLREFERLWSDDFPRYCA